MKFKKLSILILTSLNLMTLSACSLNQNQTSKPVSTKNKQSLPDDYFQNANSFSQQQAGQKVKLHMIAQSLQNSYKKLFNVTYQPDANQIALKPTDKQVIRLIKYCYKKNPAAIKNWKSFTSGVTKTSKSVSQNSQDKTAKLSIVSPKHPNNVIFTAQNGKLTYNRFK